MRFVLVAAAKDIRRRIADPAALAIWIGIPLVLAGMLSFIGSTAGSAPRARVLLVDQDDSFLSRLLPSAASPQRTPIDLETVTLDEGRKRIGEGDGTALLIIPAGFQNAILGTGSARIELVTNPAERVLPNIVREMVEVLVEGSFYARQLFAEPINRAVGGSNGGPPADADVASVAVDISRRLQELQGVLLPPVIGLSVTTDAPDAPRLNFGQLFLPGMLFMSFLFIAQGMSFDVWEEKREWTLRRILTTPQNAGRVLLGKLLAAIAVAGIVALVGLGAAVAWFDLGWARVPAALLWCAFVAGALVSLLTLLHVYAGSQRGAELLSGVIIFPLMMIGGSFFPFESMPAWMAAVGQWTPNGLGVARLKELLYGDVSASALGLAAAGIGIPAVIAFFAATRRLRDFANA